MAGMKGISAPTIYVCTRMRVRKAKLLPREEYQRMLNMSLPEITRIIEETSYKQEIDELGTTFKGIDLLEVALSWNLAKEYQRILEIARDAQAVHPCVPQVLGYPERAHDPSRQNAGCEIREDQGSPCPRRQALTRPCSTGSLTKTARTVSSTLLKGGGSTRCSPGNTRRKGIGVVCEDGERLYKQFYAEIITEAGGEGAGGRLFLAYHPARY